MDNFVLDKLRPIDPALVEELERAFPNRLPTNSKESLADVMFSAGAAAVVRWVKALHEEQKRVLFESEHPQNEAPGNPSTARVVRE